MFAEYRTAVITLTIGVRFNPLGRRFAVGDRLLIGVDIAVMMLMLLLMVKMLTCGRRGRLVIMSEVHCSCAGVMLRLYDSRHPNWVLLDHAVALAHPRHRRRLAR